MENTLENKAKFYALYYDQRIAMCRNSFKGIQPYGCLSHCMADEIIYLQLKPTTKVSIPDLLAICAIAYDFEPDEELGGQIIHEITFFEDCYTDLGYGVQKILALYDYLRSKGYALPWMGLSVEKQIEYNWIQLC